MAASAHDEILFEPTQNTQIALSPRPADISIDAAPSLPRPWGRLVSLCAPHESLELTDDEYLFGRGRGCSPGLQFDDVRISGKHCKLRHTPADDGGSYFVFLTDLSTNGTFVNGRKLGKRNRIALQNNDEIALVLLKKGEALLTGPAKAASVAYLFQLLDAGGLSVAGSGSVADSDEAASIGRVYALQQTLGTGAFAYVKLAYDLRTGARVAVKVIDKAKFRLNKNIRQDSLRDEVLVLSRIKHPNVISIVDSYETPASLYIVLELLTGGELFGRIVEQKRFSERVAFSYFVQIVDAVRYLHSQGIVHRDLKPENILLDADADNATIRITDFGLARILGESQFTTTMCGTPQYLAPEVITSQDTDAGYSFPVDLWSMGVILYVMLSGTPPFYEERRVPIYTQVTSGMVHFEPSLWASVSRDAIDLITRLLTVAPHERATIEDIYAHPWIKRMDPTHVPVDGTPVPLAPVPSMTPDDAADEVRPLPGAVVGGKHARDDGDDDEVDVEATARARKRARGGDK